MLDTNNCKTKRPLHLLSLSENILKLITRFDGSPVEYCFTHTDSFFQKPS